MDTIFIPGESGPRDPYRLARLRALVGEDTATFSSREQATVDKAHAHGECYWARITEPAPNQVLLETDLGDPGSKITLCAPRGFSNRRLLAALDAAAQVLLSCEPD